MVIDKSLIDNLTEQARSSSRLRVNLDLRNTPEDSSQRMLNALEPGTEFPIHRHRNSSETIVILRGHLRLFYFNNNGQVTERFVLKPNGDSFLYGLSIPKGQWHSLECLESGTVILETKDGTYAPLSDDDILKTNM